MTSENSDAGALISGTQEQITDVVERRGYKWCQQMAFKAGAHLRVVDGVITGVYRRSDRDHYEIDPYAAIHRRG